MKELHPHIKKFWTNQGYSIRRNKPSHENKFRVFYCITWIGTKDRDEKCIAVSTAIDSSKEIAYEIMYSLQNGRLYSATEMLKIIKMKAFI